MEQKRVLIYCNPNTKNTQDSHLGVNLLNMIQEWIETHGLLCMKTENSFLKDIKDIDKWDKVVFIHTTDNPTIKEFMFKKENNNYQLDIRGFEWTKIGNLTDNSKLNLEQTFQFITRHLSGWALIKKNLPIHMLCDEN